MHSKACFLLVKYQYLCTIAQYVGSKIFLFPRWFLWIARALRNKTLFKCYCASAQKITLNAVYPLPHTVTLRICV